MRPSDMSDSDHDEDAEFEKLEAGMLGKTRGRRKRASPQKPTPPPLPSDSPLRQSLEEKPYGTVQNLPPEPKPKPYEVEVRRVVRRKAEDFRPQIVGLCAAYRDFVATFISDGRVSAYQKGWLASAGFHLQMAVDHLDVGLKEEL